MMVFMKKLPIDVSDIETMLTGNYAYADKTKHIYELITGGRLYFLSRPRRFGKSLLISTLREIFSGNKQLFKDLWIGKSSYDWPKHPVITLDFTRISHATADALNADLVWTLEDIARKNEISITDAPSLETKLYSLVSQLSTFGRVVVLVDEYDYPLLKTVHSIERTKSLREALSSFFAALKGLDSEGCLKGIFITGVTKFSKTSIFSGMNNLNDISLDEGAANLLGYTEEEIQTYFSDMISLFSHKRGISTDAIMEEMTTWYNGYKFSENGETKSVYNPFSILYYLQKQKLENYWFESGTPTFLIDLIKNQYSPSEYYAVLENSIVSRKSLGAFDVESKLPLHTLLFQTGYLTIKSYDAKLKAYTLRCPNEEVKLSLTTHLLSAAARRDDDEDDKKLLLDHIVEEVRKKI
jgi:hypothetical protein